MNFLAKGIQKLSSGQTDRQTDTHRHTHREETAGCTDRKVLRVSWSGRKAARAWIREGKVQKVGD